MARLTFTATEARQRFFELLNLAEEGKEPIIVKKDANLKFRLVRIKETNWKEKRQALEDIRKMNLHIGKWEGIKKIIDTRYES